LARESSFKTDLLGLVDGADAIFFLVDDTLIVGEVPLGLAVRCLDAHRDLVGFSLRLGRNTTYCYPMDSPQRRPRFSDLGDGVLAFDWTEGEYDFGYPLELSSSIYRASDIRPLLIELPYQDPNTLEAALAVSLQGFRLERPRLACLTESVAVSVPANIVQTAWRNRVGSDPNLDRRSLLARYEGGERIDVDSYRGFVPDACHQELGYVFRGPPSEEHRAATVGTEASSGRYVQWAGIGDILPPTVLEAATAALERDRNLGFVYEDAGPSSPTSPAPGGLGATDPDAVSPGRGSLRFLMRRDVWYRVHAATPDVRGPGSGRDLLMACIKLGISGARLS
jgi:hypothetical protein